MVLGAKPCPIDLSDKKIILQYQFTYIEQNFKYFTDDTKIQGHQRPKSKKKST